MGYSAIVDDEDYDRISQFKWRADFRSLQYVRAKRCVFRDGSYRTILMHHQVLNVIPISLNGKVVDHINRNPLDNRKENLRIVSQSRNLRNTSVHDLAVLKGTRSD